MAWINVNYCKKTFSGVTLIEMFLVLSIVGFIIATSARLYMNVSIQSQATNIMSYVQGIAGIADQYYFYSGAGYSNISSANLPDNLANSPWGPVSLSSTSSNSYSIRFANVGNKVCSVLVMMLASNNNYSLLNPCDTSPQMTIVYTVT